MAETTIRCYAHVFDPDHQGGSHHAPLGGWPAHEWGHATEGKCQQCPDLVAQGDPYICVDGGIIHARCVAALDAEVLGGADRG